MFNLNKIIFYLLIVLVIITFAFGYFRGKNKEQQKNLKLQLENIEQNAKINKQAADINFNNAVDLLMPSKSKSNNKPSK